MRVIHKYPLDMQSATTRIFMPVGAQVLAVQMQGDQVMLWAEHKEATATQEGRTFTAVGTGRIFREGMTYIGTVQHVGYVWHIYEV